MRGSYGETIVFKNFRQSAQLAQSKPKTKHQDEMERLRAYHEQVMKNPKLRQAALVGSGVFVNNADGKLVVAKPYESIIFPKHAV